MTDPLDLGLELECKYCDYKETIIVPEADYISWHNGELINTRCLSISNSGTT
jgi:hypothetical protein